MAESWRLFANFEFIGSCLSFVALRNFSEEERRKRIWLLFVYCLPGEILMKTGVNWVLEIN